MRSEKRNTLYLIILCLFLSCAQDTPYTIAYISSLSGPNSDMGEAGRNGVLLAVEEFNAAGGLKGRHIDLIVKDHQMDINQLSHIIKAFDEAGVEIVIGPLTSSMTTAILPLAEARGMTILSPTASSGYFLGIDDNLIRLNSTTKENTQYYADFMIHTAGLNSCGILYDSQNDVFTLNWLENFTHNYEALGGRVLIEKEFSSKLDTSFNSELEQIRQSGAESLLIIANSIDTAAMVQQLRYIDKELPVIVSEWAGTRQLIELGGRAVEGVVVLQSFDPFDDSELYTSFHNQYLERFQSKPSFASVLSYDACLVLFQALQSRKDGEGIKSAILGNGPYQGIQETIHLDSFGDSKRKAVFSVIKNGQFWKIE